MTSGTISEGFVIIPNLATFVKRSGRAFSVLDTTNIPASVQFRRDMGDPLVSGPASLGSSLMQRHRDEQAGLAGRAARDKTIISLAEEPDAVIRFKHGTLDRSVCKKCRSAIARTFANRRVVSRVSPYLKCISQVLIRCWPSQCLPLTSRPGLGSTPDLVSCTSLPCGWPVIELGLVSLAHRSALRRHTP
jgi:hypothetical protein